MNICKNCIYWSSDLNYRSELGLSKCKRAKMLWDATKWDEDNFERVEIDPSIKMYVQDGSDYYASLLTKADFGCVEFKKRGNE